MHHEVGAVLKLSPALVHRSFEKAVGSIRSSTVKSKTSKTIQFTGHPPGREKNSKANISDSRNITNFSLVGATNLDLAVSIWPHHVPILSNRRSRLTLALRYKTSYLGICARHNKDCSYTTIATPLHQ